MTSPETVPPFSFIDSRLEAVDRTTSPVLGPESFAVRKPEAAELYQSVVDRMKDRMVVAPEAVACANVLVGFMAVPCRIQGEGASTHVIFGENAKRAMSPVQHFALGVLYDSLLADCKSMIGQNFAHACIEA